jgi:hypothetical protein
MVFGSSQEKMQNSLGPVVVACKQRCDKARVSINETMDYNFPPDQSCATSCSLNTDFEQGKTDHVDHRDAKVHLVQEQNMYGGGS